MDELDIPNGCWDAPPIGDLQVGDVCERVPFAVLVDERIDNFVDLDEQDLEVPDSPFRRFVPFRFSFALVVGQMAGYSVVVAVGTAAHMKPEAHQDLVDTGRWARSHARLPPIPHDPYDSWDNRDGIAFLSHIESFPTTALLPLRVASMTDDAREILQQRVGRTVAFD